MYYFKVTIEAHNGQIRRREGCVPGLGYLDACDGVDDLVEDWGATLLDIKLFEIDNHGEMTEVLTTVKQPIVLTGRKNERKYTPPEILYPLQYATRWTVPQFKTQELKET